MLYGSLWNIQEKPGHVEKRLPAAMGYQATEEIQSRVELPRDPAGRDQWPPIAGWFSSWPILLRWMMK